MELSTLLKIIFKHKISEACVVEKSDKNEFQKLTIYVKYYKITKTRNE